MGVRDVIILIQTIGMEESDLSLRTKVTCGEIWKPGLIGIYLIFIFPGAGVLGDATKYNK